MCSLTQSIPLQTTAIQWCPRVSVLRHIKTAYKVVLELVLVLATVVQLVILCYPITRSTNQIAPNQSSEIMDLLTGRFSWHDSLVGWCLTILNANKLSRAMDVFDSGVFLRPMSK